MPHRRVTGAATSPRSATGGGVEDMDGLPIVHLQSGPLVGLDALLKRMFDLFFGGILLTIGLLTRPAAAAVFVIMMVAVFKVHLGNGFFWLKAGYEYPLLWGVVALGLVFGGSGKLSVDDKLGKEF